MNDPISGSAKQDVQQPPLSTAQPTVKNKKWQAGVDCIYKGKRIAADTIACRLSYGERRGAGNGGVYRVTAALQRVKAGLRGKRLGRRNDTARAINEAAPGRIGKIVRVKTKRHDTIIH